MSRLAKSLPLAVPLVLAALVFARVVTFPFVNWDDPSHFTANPLTEHPLARGFVGLLQTREIGYPAPCLLLSFSLDHALWGWWPAPYHAENLLLHLANVALLFRMGRRLGLTPLEACAVATLFAVHPLVVEPVSWGTGRKDLLSTALVFGASLLVAGAPERSEIAAPWRWIVANIALACAVLVLPRAVVGGVVVALVVHGIRPDWSMRAVAVRLAPGFSFALVAMVLGARQLSSLGGVPPPRSLADVAGDVGGAWALQSFHLAFPVDLLSYYFRSPGDPPAWGMLVAALVALGVLALLVRSPIPASRTGALLAIVVYAPISCLFVIRRWTADSYMYVPIAAIALAVVPAIARAWPLGLRRFGLSAAGALAVVLALLSFAGTARWRSSAAVWAGSIRRYPDQPLSYEHEALGLAADGRLAEANPIFVALAERFPDWQEALDDEVRAYEAEGRPDRADELLLRGARAGSQRCIHLYWLRLLVSPTPPPASQRDLVATAFDREMVSMTADIGAPGPFLRAAAVLQSVGLEARARRAAEHAAALSAARP